MYGWWVWACGLIDHWALSVKWVGGVLVEWGGDVGLFLHCRKRLKYRG